MSEYSEYPSHHRNAALSESESHRHQQQYHQPQQVRQAHTRTPTSDSIYNGDYDQIATQHDRQYHYEQQEENYDQLGELGGSTSNTFGNTPEPFPQERQHQQVEGTKAQRFRLKVLRMATVRRLRLLWGSLALFGTMSWLALMPAYAFSQQALLSRVINHPVTQTTTIVISIILTLLNFFSWIILASNSYGAKTNCHEGPLSNKSGYVTQCRGVNTAIVLDVIVFLLWVPIAVVIVCGTIVRGLWWWGEDDGWAQGKETITRGPNMMSEEEFDLKIGMRGRAKGGVRGAGGHHHQYQASEFDPESQYIYDDIQQPKPAFVTPIASQFSKPATDMGLAVEDGEDDYRSSSPSDFPRHQQQRQQLQSQRHQHEQQQQQ
ncbi:hypothetical protein BGX28_004217 [Mortierella sp. GBA30]|nr:hypothetical protein BGX28_004217 [Mortierella sp. GBA30]